jgi:hypothetical protein
MGKYFLIDQSVKRFENVLNHLNLDFLFQIRFEPYRPALCRLAPHVCAPPMPYLALSLLPRTPAAAIGPRLAPVPLVSHTHSVAHAHHPPLFMRQQCRPHSTVGGRYRLPRAVHCHASPPLSSFSLLHADTPTPTPPFFPLCPAPPSRFSKALATASSPFHPVLLLSSPEPPEPSTTSPS